MGIFKRTRRRRCKLISEQSRSREAYLKDRRTIGQRAGGRHFFLCRMAGDLENKVILDLGCGFGWFEKYATKMKCARILGVDTDEVSLERARTEAPAAEFVQGDVTELVADFAEGPGRFDIVAMFDFFEHLPRGKEAALLATTTILLEPTVGRLLISIPYLGLITTTLDPAFYLGHRHYRLGEMETKPNEAGLSVERVVYAGGIWEQLSMIWLYVFKWIFAREMPFASFCIIPRRKKGEGIRGQPPEAGRTQGLRDDIPRGPATKVGPLTNNRLMKRYPYMNGTARQIRGCRNHAVSLI